MAQWDGGWYGSWHAGVREYWTRQWGLIDPQVEAVTFDLDEAGRVVVGVHQVVRNLSGESLLDRMVEHVYTIEDGLIRTMEIRN